jgi:hypothetical protein
MGSIQSFAGVGGGVLQKEVVAIGSPSDDPASGPPERSALSRGNSHKRLI